MMIEILPDADAVARRAAALIAADARAAVAARSDESTVILARTDARGVENFDAAVARARQYIAAGADWIFPEALATREEFQAFAKAIDVPLVANMTEFGKSPWITDAEFSELGYDLVLHPVTPFRLAARAVKDALSEMRSAGNQKALVEAGRLMNRGEIDAYLVREDS